MVDLPEADYGSIRDTLPEPLLAVQILVPSNTMPAGPSAPAGSAKLVAPRKGLGAVVTPGAPAAIVSTMAVTGVEEVGSTTVASAAVRSDAAFGASDEHDATRHNATTAKPERISHCDTLIVGRRETRGHPANRDTLLRGVLWRY